MGRPRKYKLNDEGYAARYGVDPRTIRSWKKAGAPLDNKGAMSTWMASRRKPHAMPRGDEQPIDDDLSNIGKIKLKDLPDVTDKEGAQFTLERLARQEAVASRALDEARTTGDDLKVKIANEIWCRIAAVLVTYDQKITQARRGSGELLSREEIEVGVRAYTYYLRIGFQQSIEALADHLAAINDPAELCQEIKEALWDAGVTAAAALAVKSADLFPATKGANPKPSAAVPEWAKAAIITDLDNMLEGVPEEVQRRGAAIEKASREDG